MSYTRLATSMTDPLVPPILRRSLPMSIPDAALDDAADGDVTRRRDRRVLWVVGASMAITAVAVTLCVALEVRALDRVAASGTLRGVEAEALRAGGDEWRAMAEVLAERQGGERNHGTASATAEPLGDARLAFRRADSLLSTLVATEPREAEFREVIAPVRQGLTRYHRSVERQLHLVLAGDLAAAARVDDEETDPVFVHLQDVLGRARAQLDRRARDAALAANVAMIVIALVTVGAIVCLILRHGRRQSAEERTRAAERAISASEARFRSLVQNGSDIIVVVDDGFVSWASPSAYHALGYGDGALVGVALGALVHPDDAAQVLTFAAGPAGVEPQAPPIVQWRLRHADGRWIPIEGVRTDLRHDPAVAGVVLNMRDISDRAALQERLAHLAFHDSLTGLANRALFRDRVQHALARSSRSGHLASEVAVVFLDLDDFKTINDSLGHAMGDALLQAVAARLQQCVRAADTVARFGGDEFAVLLDQPDADGPAIAARRILDALALPLPVRGKELHVAASLGVAVAAPGEGPDELIRNADAAMYFAKKRGKRTFELFAPSMHEAALERLVMEADLREALTHGQFHLMYQPIVDIRTRGIIGFEALIRWQHPVRGLVSPAQFIPVAEETGQIVGIGRWVLAEACRQAAEWRRLLATQAGARPVGGTPLIGDPESESALISVNVSARQFGTGDRLLADVRSALEAAGLPPRCLQLEITETAMMQDSAAALAVMLKLNQLGVRIAIDDFGTGYSSLSYLEKFPVHVLKIDKGFVDDLGSGSGESSLARAIVRIARTLGMRVVAEGVETAVQAQRLLEMGCRSAQGYLFSRPIPPDQVVATLSPPEGEEAGLP
jgi:diguanylate cyclase (GGDEF)-like protein/PAS domain S-box-containing protein